MDTTEASTGTEVVRRVAGMTDLFRKHAGWQEQNRRLHQESIEALAEAGVFRLRVPTRYGGHESGARTLLDVAAELGRADGSVAWTASVYWIPTWLAGLFPDEAQEEVFDVPDVRVCGTLSPNGTAVATGGGLRVSGRWGFISGAWHSHWQEVIVMVPLPDGGQEPTLALVPMSEMKIIDDWHTSGLRGSGSVTTVAEDVFVPYHRTLSLPDVLRQRYASVRNAELPMFRSPLPATAAASSVGTPIGLARAAMENFMERLPNRKITFTDYASQAQAPVTHHQVAASALKADQAGFHGDRVAGLVDRKAIAGEQWSVEERVRARADVGAVGTLAKEAVDILDAASGGSSISLDVPIQRIGRDVHALNQHALISGTTGFETYGRVLCGLEPNTSFV